MVFFTAYIEYVEEVDEDGEKGEDIQNSKIGLFSYDPESKAIELIDDNARSLLYRGSAFFGDDYYIRSGGYDQERDRVIYCRRSYDGSSEEFFDSLPDGTPFEIFGWHLKPDGIFANTEPNGGVYVAEDKKCLMCPTDSATTYPVRYKNSFYFQTRGTEFVKLGKDPETKSVVMGYRYDKNVL